MSEPILKVIATAQNILQQARLSVEGQPDLATSSSEVIRLNEEAGHKQVSFYLRESLHSYTLAMDFS